ATTSAGLRRPPWCCSRRPSGPSRGSPRAAARPRGSGSGSLALHGDGDGQRGAGAGSAGAAGALRAAAPRGGAGEAGEDALLVVGPDPRPFVAHPQRRLAVVDLAAEPD